jgi:hypothetical protein
MKELVGMGLKKVGDWFLLGNSIDFALQKQSDKNNVLHSFIANNTIMYIGQSTNTLLKRMGQYQNPEPTQETNVRVNAEIKKSLNKGQEIEIYAIEYDDSFSTDSLINIETRLIKTKKPEWNREGKK